MKIIRRARISADMYSLSISLEAALLIKVLSCYSAQIISLLATAPLRSAVSWARFLALPPLSAFVHVCIFFIPPSSFFTPSHRNPTDPYSGAHVWSMQYGFQVKRKESLLLVPLRCAGCFEVRSVCSQIPRMKALPSHLGKSEITSCIGAVSSWKQLQCTPASQSQQQRNPGYAAPIFTNVTTRDASSLMFSREVVLTNITRTLYWHHPDTAAHTHTHLSD